MARRLTEIYSREAFLAPFKLPRTKKFADLKPMAGAGEDSMMEWESFSFIEPYFNPDGQFQIELPDNPPTQTFVDTHSEPDCDRFSPNAKMEVQAIAGSSSAAEVSTTSSAESFTAQAKRRAAQSFDDNSRAKDFVDSKGKEKRGRASNWSNDEKEAFLRLKLEALEKSEKSWFRFVSEQLWRRREIERADKSCQQQWDLLYKAYKAIGNLHHLKSIESQSAEEHGPVSFWDMDESARMAMKKRWNEELKYLPGVFPKEWYDLMEKIIVLQAQVKKTQDVKAMIHVGELNREPSTSTRADAWPQGALDSSTILPNQALGSSNIELCHDCIKQQSNDKLLPDDEELMSRIILLVDKQIEQALLPGLLRREDSENEQKYREDLRAREGEHKRRLQAIEAEHSQRLLAIEAEHSRRLQAIEAELLRRVEEVEQKHRKSLLDMLDEEELAASLKLTTIKERKRELA